MYHAHMEQHRMISATLETVIKRLYQKEDIKSIFVTPYMKFWNPLNVFPMGSSKIRFVLIADLVKAAKRSVIFIDPFATIEVLKFAAMRNKGVKAVIYSARITPEFETAKNLHNKQYPDLDLKTMRTIHDRFLLIDDTVYHFGASFKDMGNEMTAYSVLNFITHEEVIAKVGESMRGNISSPSA